MDRESIEAIVREIEPLLLARAAGKIFQLGPTALAIDFGLRDRGFLFLSVDPADARLHLIKRRVRDLEKQSLPLNQFSLTVRKELSGTRLFSVTADVGDRIVRFQFGGEDDLGQAKSRTLIAQLTGRSANLLLLDDDQVIHTLRNTKVAGQQPGEPYGKPKPTKPTPEPQPSNLLTLIASRQIASPSEAADSFYTALAEEKERAAQLATARATLDKKISQQRKLLKQLQTDLQSHANAEEHKRIGDLLLANLSTAGRRGDRVILIDYFSDDASSIEVQLDESLSLPQEAARRFARYSRAKRATTQIAKRIEMVNEQLRELHAQEQLLEHGASPAAGEQKGGPASKSFSSARETKTPRRIPGTRRYTSSDGLEILVGRTAQDNDHLTFKVAKPNDLWLHAADYGGSHVVVRNLNRKPVPHRTMIEAAQLAAYFSQAKKESKADVHYTERKFVAKIKGGKPGLVRMQRFKNITVEPKEVLTRI